MSYISIGTLPHLTLHPGHGGPHLGHGGRGAGDVWGGGGGYQVQETVWRCKQGS